MSKVTEMAEAEAARAEAEPEPEPDEPSEPEPGGPEPEPEFEPEAKAKPSMEAALKAFEKENTRHEVALRKIMGDDFESFVLCAGCEGIGYRAIEAMPFAPDLERCARCKGHGSELTGSIAPGKEVRECIDCQGQGFRVIVQQPEFSPVPSAPVPRFDPYTGELLPAGAHPNGGGQQGPWAPGYVPLAGPAPALPTGS